MKTFLENLEMLSLAAGTSGDEAAVKKLIYDEVIGYSDCVAKTDNAGNLIVSKKGKKQPKNKKSAEPKKKGAGKVALIIGIVAAVILGRYTPFGTVGAALIFGAATALQIRLQAIGIPLPANAFAMLPYVITLVALLGSIGRSNEPESLSKPYIRGSR